MEKFHFVYPDFQHNTCEIWASRASPDIISTQVIFMKLGPDGREFLQTYTARIAELADRIIHTRRPLRYRVSDFLFFINIGGITKFT